MAGKEKKEGEKEGEVALAQAGSPASGSSLMAEYWDGNIGNCKENRWEVGNSLIQSHGKRCA